MGDEKKSSEHINLKVLGQDNAIIQFKIKKHTPLRKLMTAYCERACLAKEAVRFRFDGAPVNEMDTPETLEMEEGDTIEVYQPQTGGSLLYLTDCSTLDLTVTCQSPERCKIVGLFFRNQVK